jgi:hypothetical protein
LAYSLYTGRFLSLLWIQKTILKMAKYISGKKPFVNAFANIVDKNETTVFIEQSKYNDEDIIEIEKDWKILTF